MTARRMTFGVQTAPSTDTPKSDRILYEEVIEDVQLADRLGYESVWMLEHHFSDYYPTPSPLLFMAHVAALCPNIGLGTSVLVLPWYHPVRIAEEISMLNSLTRGTLHLGLGRGTAKSEYDAYGVSMPEARGRFAETLDIIRKGLSGEEFTHEGTYHSVPRPIRLRPEPIGKPVKLYGAIGSPQSASVMADLGIPPLCLSTFPAGLLGKILGTWDERAAPGADRTKAISIKMLIADSDEEALRLARRYFPPYFALQADHYEADANPWENIEEYQQFSRMFSNLRKLADPDALGPYCEMNLVGSVETAIARLGGYAELGFDYALVSAATPGMPKDLQREVMARFAREVMPKFSADDRAEAAE